MINGAEGAVIEIIERTNDPDPDLIVPNEIRINGQKLLCPAERPVEVHGIKLGDGDVVLVTLTLFAKRITVGAEPKSIVTRDAAGQIVHEKALP